MVFSIAFILQCVSEKPYWEWFGPILTRLQNFLHQFMLNEIGRRSCVAIFTIAWIWSCYTLWKQAYKKFTQLVTKLSSYSSWSTPWTCYLHLVFDYDQENVTHLGLVFGCMGAVDLEKFSGVYWTFDMPCNNCYLHCNWWMACTTSSICTNQSGQTLTLSVNCRL